VSKPSAILALPVAVVTLVLGLGVQSASAHRHGGRPIRGNGRLRWQPKPTTKPWQWQLQGAIDTSINAAVYDVDGFETPAHTIRELHRQGRKVVCYLDVGSWESYRPDAGQFPNAVIGNRYQGFPDERWLDVSRFHLFERPLERRFAMCARKGFDAVEPTTSPAGNRKTRPASTSPVPTSCASTAGLHVRCIAAAWRWR